MFNTVIAVSERKTTVTVRGVDRQLYEELVRLARETGRNIGDLINVAMRLLLANVKAGLEFFGKKLEEVSQNIPEPAATVTIEGVEELEISKRDLLEAGRPVVFKGLKRLVFSNDVDPETFERSVHSIVAVDEVVVPSSLPKLLVASRCRLVKRVVTRD